MVQISTSSSLFQLFLPIYSFKFVHLYIMLFYSVLYLLYQLTLFLFSGFRCAFNIYYPAIVSVSQRCHSRVCSRASCAHCGSVVLMPHSLRRVLFSFFFLFSGIFRGVFFFLQVCSSSFCFFLAVPLGCASCWISAVILVFARAHLVRNVVVHCSQFALVSCSCFAPCVVPFCQVLFIFSTLFIFSSSLLYLHFLLSVMGFLLVFARKTDGNIFRQVWRLATQSIPTESFDAYS